MKKRKDSKSGSERKEEAKINELLALSRTQRLLTVALQMPQVQRLFIQISRKKHFTCLADNFQYWKSMALLYRQEKQRLQQLRQQSALRIQCLIRKFLAIRRVKHRKKLKEERILQKRHQSALQLQCFVRIIFAKRKVQQLRLQKLKKDKHLNAIIIQRVFRGYLARGCVILLHRNRLIRQIRVWANGISANILHITDLQDIDQQALLQTAINFMTIPSKPIRNLPSIALLKSYRAGLYGLQWQLQTRYTQKKLTIKRLIEDRKLMQYEEMHSITRETMDRIAYKKILKKKEEEKYNEYLQEQERLRRQEFIAAQFLKDLHNRGLLEERERKERNWRQKQKIQQELEWIEKTIQARIMKENEQMKYEESLSRKYQSSIKEFHKQRVITQKQFQRIAMMKQQQFSITKMITTSSTYKQKKPLTYEFLYQRCEKQIMIIYDHIYQFINYLPFHKSYLEKLLRRFQEMLQPTFFLGDTIATPMHLSVKSNKTSSADDRDRDRSKRASIPIDASLSMSGDSTNNNSNSARLGRNQKSSSRIDWSPLPTNRSNDTLPSTSRQVGVGGAAAVAAMEEMIKEKEKEKEKQKSQEKEKEKEKKHLFKHLFITHYIDFILHLYQYNYDAIYDHIMKYNVIVPYTSLKYDLQYLKKLFEQKRMNRDGSTSLQKRNSYRRNNYSFIAKEFSEKLVKQQITESDFVEVYKYDILYFLQKLLLEYHHYYEDDLQAKLQEDLIQNSSSSSAPTATTTPSGKKGLNSTNNSSGNLKMVQASSTTTAQRSARGNGRESPSNLPTSTPSNGTNPPPTKGLGLMPAHSHLNLVKNYEQGSLFGLFTVQNMMKYLKDGEILINIEDPSATEPQNNTMNEDANLASSGKAPAGMAEEPKRARKKRKSKNRRNSTAEGVPAQGTSSKRRGTASFNFTTPISGSEKVSGSSSAKERRKISLQAPSLSDRYRSFSQDFQPLSEKKISLSDKVPRLLVIDTNALFPDNGATNQLPFSAKQSLRLSPKNATFISTGGGETRNRDDLSIPSTLVSHALISLSEAKNGEEKDDDEAPAPPPIAFLSRTGTVTSRKSLVSAKSTDNLAFGPSLSFKGSKNTEANVKVPAIPSSTANNPPSTAAPSPHSTRGGGGGSGQLILKYRYTYPPEIVVLYLYLIQYKYIKNQRINYFHHLLSLVKEFPVLLSKLSQIRQELKKGKITLRSERKELLQQAEEYELKLMQLRNEMISTNHILYEMMYFEIRLFFMLFYSKKGMVGASSGNVTNPSTAAGAGLGIGVGGSASGGSSSSNSTTNSIYLQYLLSKRPPPPKAAINRARKSAVTTASTGSRRRRSGDGAGAGEGGGGRGAGRRQSLLTGNVPPQQPSRRGSALVTTVISSPDALSADGDQRPTSSSSTAINSTNEPIRRGSVLLGRKNSVKSGQSSPNPSGKSTTKPAIYEKWRSFNHERDQPEFYWYDFMSISQDLQLTSLELFKILVIPPPITYFHDGFRHVYKINNRLLATNTSSRGGIGNSSRYRHSRQLDTNTSSATSSNKRQPSNKNILRKDSIAIPVIAGNSFSQNPQQTSNRDGSTPVFGINHSFNNKNINNPLMKERNFFNIPGENIFMESKAEEYDFYEWSKAMIRWIQSILHWIVKYEKKWFKTIEQEVMIYLHRLFYLFIYLPTNHHQYEENISEKLKYPNCQFTYITDYYQHVPNQPSPNNVNNNNNKSNLRPQQQQPLQKAPYPTSKGERGDTSAPLLGGRTYSGPSSSIPSFDPKYPQQYFYAKDSFHNSHFYLQIIASKIASKEIDMIDLYELLLGCNQTNIFIQLLSMETFPPKTLSSYTLLGKDLDELLGKNPISLLTRQLILQEIENQKFDLLPMKWMKEQQQKEISPLSLTMMVQQHDNAILSLISEMTDLLQNPFLATSHASSSPGTSATAAAVSSCSWEELYQKYYTKTVYDPMISDYPTWLEEEEDNEERDNKQDTKEGMKEQSSSSSRPGSLNKSPLKIRFSTSSRKPPAKNTIPTNTAIRQIAKEKKEKQQSILKHFFYLPKDHYWQEIKRNSAFVQQFSSSKTNDAAPTSVDSSASSSSSPSISAFHNYNYNYPIKLLAIIEKEYYELQETISMLLETRVIRIQDNTISVRPNPTTTTTTTTSTTTTTAATPTTATNTATPENIISEVAAAFTQATAAKNAVVSSTIRSSTSAAAADAIAPSPAQSKQSIPITLPLSTNVTLLYQPWLLFNTVDRSHYYRNLVHQIQTDKDWFYVFPLFVQPILYFGSPAKEQTYEEKLLKEFQQQLRQQRFTQMNSPAVKPQQQPPSQQLSEQIILSTDSSSLLSSTAPERKTKQRRNSIKDLTDALLAKNHQARGSPSSSLPEQSLAPKIGKYFSIFLKDILYSCYAKILLLQFQKRQALYRYLNQCYQFDYYTSEMEPLLFEYEDHRSRVANEFAKQTEEYFLIKYPTKGKFKQVKRVVKPLSSPGPAAAAAAAASKTKTAAARRGKQQSPSKGHASRNKKIQEDNVVVCCECFPSFFSNKKKSNSKKTKIHAMNLPFPLEEEEGWKEIERNVHQLTMKKHPSRDSPFQQSLHFLNHIYPSKRQQFLLHSSNIRKYSLLSANYRNFYQFFVRMNYSFDFLYGKGTMQVQLKRKRDQYLARQVNKNNNNTNTESSREKNRHSFNSEEEKNHLEERDQVFFSLSEDGEMMVHEPAILPDLGNYEDDQEEEDDEEEEEEDDDSDLLSLMSELSLDREVFLCNVYERVLQFISSNATTQLQQTIEKLNITINQYYSLISSIHHDMKLGKTMQLLRQAMLSTSTSSSSSDVRMIQPIKSWVTGESLTNYLQPQREPSIHLTRRASLAEERSSQRTIQNSSPEASTRLSEQKDLAISIPQTSSIPTEEPEEEDWLLRSINQQKQKIFNHNLSISTSFYQYFLQLASTSIEQEPFLSKSSSHSISLSSCCEELLVFGGIRRVIQLFRVVEHPEINSRGIIIIEEFCANIYGQVKMNAEYHSTFVLPMNNAAAAASSSSAAPSDYNSALSNLTDALANSPALASLVASPSSSPDKKGASLNPTTFSVPIMSLIRQTSSQISLWNLAYHKDIHALIRSGFLQYDNRFIVGQGRRVTRIAPPPPSSPTKEVGGSGKLISSNENSLKGLRPQASSSPRVNLLYSLEGKKQLLTSLSLKSRYLIMIVENQWKLLKGLIRFQALIRGRKLRRKDAQIKVIK